MGQFGWAAEGPIYPGSTVLQFQDIRILNYEKMFDTDELRIFLSLSVQIKERNKQIIFVRFFGVPAKTSIKRLASLSILV